jgi:hypothetical protein
MLPLSPACLYVCAPPPRRRTILQRLSKIQGAPSVGFHERAPDGLQLDDIHVGRCTALLSMPAGHW